MQNLYLDRAHEPDHPDAKRLDESLTFRVVGFRLGGEVRIPIEFDRRLRRHAIEVEAVRPDAVLLAEPDIYENLDGVVEAIAAALRQPIPDDAQRLDKEPPASPLLKGGYI